MLRAYSKSAATGKRLGAPKGTGRVAGVTADYADALLAALGHAPSRLTVVPDPHPALAWAASGAMALTGLAEGPPVIAPGHITACARGAVRALAALAGDDAMHGIDGAALLGERAALLGLTRRGTTSVGGGCRLLRARDGWIAVNLPRSDDFATVPAWLEITLGTDPWSTIADTLADRAVGPVVARARLLGLAVATASTPVASSPPCFRLIARGTPLPRPPVAHPVVLDLSGLWAGPLASHLLQRAGARVIKVESSRRPDGTRLGSPSFFDLLNGGKESVALDFSTAGGRADLARLVTGADIVIESSRPRALAQLGIDAHTLVTQRPGLTWIQITGYGCTGPEANWIGFGDDAATAAGLAMATGAMAGMETPLFCGDAIADPLTGMHAAVAALAAYRRGGGLLLSLALRDVAAHVLGFGPATSAATVSASPLPDATWEVIADGDGQAVQPARARHPDTVARPLGSDTDAVLSETRDRL